MTTSIPISKRLVAVNSASSLIAAALNVSVLVWLQQFLIKRISPEEYSLYPVVAVIGVIAPLFSVILTAGLGRYVVEAYARGDRSRVTEIASSMFPLLAGAATLLLIAGLAVAWFADVVFNIPEGRLADARLMIALLTFMVSLRLMLATFGVGLHVHQKFVLANMLELGGVTLRIAILFVLLFGVSVRVQWVVVASVTAESLRLAVHTTISMRLVPELRFCVSAMRRATVRQITGFGFWRILGRAAESIRLAADPIILNRFAAPIDVSCFYLGSLVSNQIQTFTVVAASPLQPALTAMHATDDRSRLRNTFMRGGRYGLWACMALATPMIIFRRELIELYVAAREPEYLPAATVMGLLLAVYPLWYGNIMLPRIAHATARVRPEAVCTFTMQICNLVLTLYLVRWRHMGAVGSALSTFLIAAVFQPLAYLPLALRMTGTTLAQWLRSTLLPGLAPAAIGALLWWALRQLLAPTSWALVLTSIAAGYLIYFAVLFVWCLAPHEKQDIRRFWQRFARRKPGVVP